MKEKTSCTIKVFKNIFLLVCCQLNWLTLSKFISFVQSDNTKLHLKILTNKALLWAEFKSDFSLFWNVFYFTFLHIWNQIFYFLDSSFFFQKMKTRNLNSAQNFTHVHEVLSAETFYKFKLDSLKRFALWSFFYKRNNIFGECYLIWLNFAWFKKSRKASI